MAKSKNDLLDRGQKALSRGKPDLALDLYTQALDMDPSDPRVRMRIAAVHLKTGKRDLALEQLRIAADNYRKTGQDQKALAVYRQMLQTDGDDLRAIEGMAAALGRMGLKSEAIEWLRRKAAILEESGELWEAIEVTEGMMDMDPQNLVVAAKLSDLYYRHGMPEKAYASLAQVLDRLRAEPSSTEALLGLLEKVAALDPANESNLDELASLYAELERHGESVLTLELLARRRPDDPGLLARIAGQAAQGGDGEKALDIYRRALELEKSAGNQARAARIVESMAAIDPEAPEAGELEGLRTAAIAADNGGGPGASSPGLEGASGDDPDDLVVWPDRSADPEPDDHEDPGAVSMPDKGGHALPPAREDKALPPSLEKPARLLDLISEARLFLHLDHGGEYFAQVRIETDGARAEVHGGVRVRDKHRAAGIERSDFDELEGLIEGGLRGRNVEAFKQFLAGIIAGDSGAPLLVRVPGECGDGAEAGPPPDGEGHEEVREVEIGVDAADDGEEYRDDAPIVEDMGLVLEQFTCAEGLPYFLGGENCAQEPGASEGAGGLAGGGLAPDPAGSAPDTSEARLERIEAAVLRISSALNRIEEKLGLGGGPGPE